MYKIGIISNNYYKWQEVWKEFSTELGTTQALNCTYRWCANVKMSSLSTVWPGGDKLSVSMS